MFIDPVKNKDSTYKFEVCCDNCRYSCTFYMEEPCYSCKRSKNFIGGKDNWTSPLPYKIERKTKELENKF